MNHQGADGKSLCLCPRVLLQIFVQTGLTLGSPSVLVALRDPAHPFISSHPTISSIRAILNDEPSEASASEENTKGKGKEDGNDVAAILRHALCWGLERSDNELVSWLCNLEGRWVSQDCPFISVQVVSDQSSAGCLTKRWTSWKIMMDGV